MNPHNDPRYNPYIGELKKEREDARLKHLTTKVDLLQAKQKLNGYEIDIMSIKAMLCAYDHPGNGNEVRELIKAIRNIVG